VDNLTLELWGSRLDDHSQVLAEEAAKVVVGPGWQHGVHARPVQNAAQLAQVKRLAASARDAGGDFFFAGEVPDGPGYWAPTTLVPSCCPKCSALATPRTVPAAAPRWCVVLRSTPTQTRPVALAWIMAADESRSQSAR
jgi:hypothetical protein